MVVPLVGDVHIEWSNASGSGSIDLEGRASVFDGPPDVAYLGVGTAATLTGSGRVAVAEAPATEVLDVEVLRKADIPVEIRGAGRSTRQVHNFGTPAGLARAEAHRLRGAHARPRTGRRTRAHKHDEAMPGVESRLEEIYYFEAEVSRGVDAPAEAAPFGMFATYSSPAGEIAIDADGALGRHRPGAVRLPRPCGRRPRLRPLLPQRDGRARPRAGVAHHRRPGPRLGSRPVGDQDPDPRLPYSPASQKKDNVDDDTAPPTTRNDRRARRSSSSSRTSGRSTATSASAPSPACSASSATATWPVSARRSSSTTRRDPGLMPYHQARNEQAMVHQAVGYARMHRRRATFALDRVGGPRRRQHADGRGARDGQPPAGPAAAERHLRDPRLRPGAAADRAPARHEHPGDRRLPAALALLRPGRAPRAALLDRARGHARAHRPRRDRRGHHRPARRRAGRGDRRPRRVPAAPRVAHPSPAARDGPAGPSRRGHPERQAPLHRRRRRRALLGRRGRAARSSPRPPASPSARLRPAAASLALGPRRSTSAASAPPAPLAANRPRGRGRRRDRHRHPLQRLHHGVANRVPGS